MKLKRIEVKNFRLLEDVSIFLDLEKGTTVFVGPNNSGKTSMAEALELFLKNSAKHFSVSDFSLGALEALHQAEAVLAPAAAEHVAAKPGADATQQVAPIVLNLPSMSLALTFLFVDEPPDLNAVTSLLMGLDVKTLEVGLMIELSLSDGDALRTDFVDQRKKEKISLISFLEGQLGKYFETRIYRFNPTSGEREKLEDPSILQRLIRIDFLPAQRHIDDQESSQQATKLSRLLNVHYERRYKTTQPSGYEELDRAVRVQAADLIGKYATAFEDLKDSLGQFGYPRTPDLTIKAELSASTLFRDNTRVYYTT